MAMWSIDSFINIVLMVFIFSALIGTVATQITSSQANLSGATAIMLGLTTLILVIVFISNLVKSGKVK